MNARLEGMDVTVTGVEEGFLLAAHAAPSHGGDNVPPTITWKTVPGAASYAITCYDPDAPTGSGVWHWIMTDIAPTVTTVVRGAVSEGGRVFVNDLGVEDYVGAGPPPGRPHRYEFTVWALDVPALPLPAGATNAVARFLLHQHAIAAGTKVALFGSAAA